MRYLIIIFGLSLLAACGKKEPEFNDPRQIVIDGEKITAKDYVARYCSEGSDGPHCRRAREYQEAIDAVATKKPKGKF